MPTLLSAQQMTSCLRGKYEEMTSQVRSQLQLWASQSASAITGMLGAPAKLIKTFHRFQRYRLMFYEAIIVSCVADRRCLRFCSNIIIFCPSHMPPHQRNYIKKFDIYRLHKEDLISLIPSGSAWLYRILNFKQDTWKSFVKLLFYIMIIS